MNEEIYLNIVNQALDKLYNYDVSLITNDASERAIVFHFANYFENIVNCFDKFDELSVDCEYNRNIVDEKKYKAIMYEGIEYKIFPDLILHHRGDNSKNIIAIEFKKEKNVSKCRIENDYRKLRALTNQQYKYKYDLGISIILTKLRKNVKMRYFINGRKVDIKIPCEMKNTAKKFS